MKIHITVTPCGTKVGYPARLDIRSVWNEDDQVELEFNGSKFIAKGSELMDAIRRVIGRPLWSRE
jgi:hypothetical protein